MVESAPIQAGSGELEIRLLPVAADPEATSTSLGAGPDRSSEQARRARGLARIAGRLVDRAGTPVHGATVWLVRRLPGGDEVEPAPRWYSQSSRPATTNLEGEFEFAGVAQDVA